MDVMDVSVVFPVCTSKVERISVGEIVGLPHDNSTS